MQKTQHHNKLVRDNIVANLEAKNIECDYRGLDAIELVDALKTKLVEEANEVVASREINELLLELADVQEVLDAICLKCDITKDMLWAVQEAKREKAGGFNRGIFLLSTREETSQ